MEIRRFSATDTRTAMRQVRDAMGADAVILSTRPVDGGVELVSASDYDPDLLQEFATPERSEAEAPATSAEPAPAPAPADDDVQRELHATVRGLQALLEQEARRQVPSSSVPSTPQYAARATRLSECGFSSHAVRRLLAQQADSTDYELPPSQLALALLKTIGCDPMTALTDGGTIAVVGPTGVGKTTTVAKLAVRLAMRASTDDIALISTDASRLGAHYQLQSLGRLLAIPVYEVDELRELDAILPALAARRWVLIDTAGSGDTAARALALQRLVTLKGRDLSVLLALAGNAEPAFNDAVLARHSSVLSPTIALTKVDECIGLGPALSTLIKHGRPISLASTGPSIPEDLAVGSDVLPLIAARALAARNTNDTDIVTPETRNERR